MLTHVSKRGPWSYEGRNRICLSVCLSFRLSSLLSICPLRLHTRTWAYRERCRPDPCVMFLPTTIFSTIAWDNFHFYMYVLSLKTKYYILGCVCLYLLVEERLSVVSIAFNVVYLHTDLFIVQKSKSGFSSFYSYIYKVRKSVAFISWINITIIDIKTVRL